MTKILLTHTDNMPLINKLIRQAFPKEYSLWGMPPWLTIKHNRFVERWQPSKSIRLRDGTVIAREAFELRTRFVTYGPEDLRWLMWAGVVEEQLEPMFWIMDEPLFSFRLFYNGNYLGRCTEPRAVFKNSV